MKKVNPKAKDQSKELAENHWSYIQSLLETHGTLDDVMDRIEFHYKTAFLHGYGHGQEDALGHRP